MPDFFQKPNVTLAFGPPSYGKTSFCFKYLLNAISSAACVFIYDWKAGEASLRLKIPAVTTEAGCVNALARRAVVFNPHAMFPGDRAVTNPEGNQVLNDDRMGIRWFCKWAFEASSWGPGRKIIYLDDLSNFGCKHSVPPEISRIVRMGRLHGLELLTSTQFPRDYHADIRGAVTEWVCFRCTEENDLAAVRPYFRGVDKVASLPPGSFIAFNRESGGQLAGKMF